MSRHLYDIYQISQTDFGKKAMLDLDLFQRICTHRSYFTPVQGIAYDELRIEDLDFIPPVSRARGATERKS